MQGAQCGTQSQDSRITPWAEGNTKPLSHQHLISNYRVQKVVSSRIHIMESTECGQKWGFLFVCLFIRERQRQKHRQREKHAPCREPNVGLDPRTPGSCSELKADA